LAGTNIEESKMNTGKGFVVEVSTPQERRQEIDKWYGDPWYFTLGNLNARLERFDPEYTIVQIKEKFGELVFYYRTAKHSKRDEMDKAIKNATRLAAEADNKKSMFDKVAPAPGFPPQVEW
jgi:hypothetical protein